MDEQASAAMERPGRRPWSSLDPFITAAFWTLAVVILLNPRGMFPVEDNTSRLVFAGIRVLCCLLLMGLVHVRVPQAMGPHGVWILGSMASYMVIGFFVSVTTGSELLVNLYGRTFYGQLQDLVVSLVLILSSTLGAYAILERVGMQAFLRLMLMVLTASSTLVLFTPVLRSMGVILPWETLPLVDPFRFVGTFQDPNSAGYIGCLTVVPALAFLYNVRRPVFAYLALTAGFFAAVSSWSRTAVFSLGVLLVFSLLWRGRGGRGRGGRGRVLLGMGIILLTIVVLISNLDLSRLDLQVIGPRLSSIVDVVTRGKLDDETLSLRLYLWKAALDQALESPVVGHGLGRMYLLDDGIFFPTEGTISGVHNIYLLLVGEAGIVPLSLYLLYLFSLLRLHWTMPASLARDAIVGWTIVIVLQGMMFHQLFELGTYTFIGGVTCAMASYAVRGSGGRTRERPRTFARTHAASSATG